MESAPWPLRRFRLFLQYPLYVQRIIIFFSFLAIPSEIVRSNVVIILEGGSTESERIMSTFG
jgi:hypothetical protein